MGAHKADMWVSTDCGNLNPAAGYSYLPHTEQHTEQNQPAAHLYSLYTFVPAQCANPGYSYLAH